MSKKYSKFNGKIFYHNGKRVTLTRFIAKGGNSVVYECRYLQQKYVIKFFIGNRKKRYERFKSEVEKIERINELIPDCTPKVITRKFDVYNYKDFRTLDVKKSPFYIMEKGEKYNYFNLDFSTKLNNIIEICCQLKKLHDLDISHRDIKPENLILYKEKFAFIDYGTSSVPGIETIDNNERMGSLGMMAPEMITRSVSGKDCEYSDIYSLGKTIWIILTNDRDAQKFTTYSSFNVNSKLELNNVHEGIVMAIERILTDATQENYLKRISLDKITESLIMIRDGLLGNEQNCNIMKFKCFLNEIIPAYSDVILINDSSKYIETLKKISSIGINLSLEKYGRELCNSSIISSFSLKPNTPENYSFVLNEIEFVFKVKTIEISHDKVLIRTASLDDIILEENSEYLSHIDEFSRKSVLTNPLNLEIKKVYLDCDICLNTID